MQKISSFQACILLFISNAYVTVNYVPMLFGDITGSLYLYSGLLAFFLHLIILLPVYLIYKKEKTDVIAAAYQVSKPFGKLTSLIFIISMAIGIVGTMISFTFFIINTSYPYSNALIFIFTMLPLCFVAAGFGISGLARSVVIILFFLILNILFIFISNASSIEILELYPASDNPIASIFKIAFYILARNYELIVFVAIFSSIKIKKMKAVFGFILLATIFFEAVMFIVFTVLGDYSLQQAFPYYSLASTGDNSVMNRLDAIHMVLWVMLAFCRLTLLITGIKITAERSFSKKVKRIILIITFIATSVIASLSFVSVSEIENILLLIYKNILPVTICVLILPIIVLICIGIKRKKEV